MFTLINNVPLALVYGSLVYVAIEKVVGRIPLVDGMVYLHRDEVRQVVRVMMYTLDYNEYEGGSTQINMLNWWLTHTKYDALVFTEYRSVGVASLPGNRGCFTGTLTGMGF